MMNDLISYRDLVDALSKRACEFTYMYTSTLESQNKEGSENVAYHRVMSVVEQFMLGDKLYNLWVKPTLTRLADEIFTQPDATCYVMALRNYVMKGCTESEIKDLIENYSLILSSGTLPIDRNNVSNSYTVEFKRTPELEVSAASISGFLNANSWLLPLILLAGDYSIYKLMINAEYNPDDATS